jgi:hypothetical protein
MLSSVADNDTSTELPTLNYAGRAGECPKCQHSAAEQQERVDLIEKLLRKLFRMRPSAATCGADLDGGDDWGALTCNCKNAFHGS